MTISLIVAHTKNRVIGKDNGIPWHLPNDMKYFKEMTKGKHVIMGRKNWESIPEKYRPLPGRPNWVITGNPNYKAEGEGVTVVSSFSKAITGAVNASVDTDEIMIIGGGEIYKQALMLVNKMYITEIDASIDGDVFFPEIDLGEWTEISRKHNGVDERHQFEYDFVVYERGSKTQN